VLALLTVRAIPAVGVLKLMTAAAMPAMLLFFLVPAVPAVLLLPAVMHLVMLPAMWPLLGVTPVVATNVLPHVLRDDDCRNRKAAAV
jgi:hypothetical protein